MREAVRQAVREVDVTAVVAALGVLSAAKNIRVALQHKVNPNKRQPDLPGALSRIGVTAYPPDWSRGWEIVRRRVVEALGELRRALLANAPDE